ncbi:hypothetical protein VNO80_24519 [Phaseolus coccineus]|uniref:Uncharacterized protein n=1 Tax=Phaseolus coccineus TaxID=3886 RepID=A0AAN9QMX7_PHACN
MSFIKYFFLLDRPNNKYRFTGRVICNGSTRIWFYSKQILGVWFGAKCEWGEDRKIHTIEKEEGQGERVFDSEARSDAFHVSATFA